MIDDGDEIHYIIDIKKFTNILIKNSWNLFVDKCYDNIPMEFNSKYNKKNMELNISNDIIESEIKKFVIIDDNDPNEGFILKENIFRLLHSISNEMISSYLNDLVDCGKLKLCWDSKKHEFIWLTNKEK